MAQGGAPDPLLEGLRSQFRAYHHTYNQWEQSLTDEEDWIKVESGAAGLRGICDKMDVVADQLRGQVPADELDRLNVIQMQVESKCIAMECRAKLLKDLFLADQKAPKTQQGMMRLPKMTLPTFSGDVTEWRSFHAQFVASVDTQKSLPDTEKLQYLKSLVKGPPWELIRNLPMTDSGYRTAISVLEFHYSDKRRIIEQEVARIKALPAVRNFANLDELHRLYTTIGGHLAGLRELQVDYNRMEGFLLPDIEAKFPPVIGVQYHTRRLLSKKDPTVDDFLSYAHVACTASFAHSSSEVKAPSKPQATVKSKVERSVVAKQVEPKTEHRKGLTCYFCQKQGHVADDCSTFTTVESRRKAISNMSLCYNCLRKGHGVSQCTNSLRCAVCRGKHHTSIHEDRSGTPNKKATVNITQTKEEEVKSVRGKFMTFCCLAKGTGSSYQVRGIIDTASNRSFITDNAALAVVPQSSVDVYREMKLEGFGGRGSSLQNYRVLRITLTGYHNGQGLGVEVISVPRITQAEGVTEVRLIREIRKLNVDYASVLPDYDDHVDILIGTDFLWRLFTGRMMKLSEEEGLVETRLGWAYSGRAQDTSNTTSVTACQRELDHLWNLDSLGIKEDIAQEDPAIKDLSDRIQQDKQGRYSIPLPVLDKITKLQNNFTRAKQQLKSTVMSLQKDEEKRKRYCEAMNKYVDLGHSVEVEIADPSDLDKGYYLPHHAVFKEDRTTTKTRIVFNASSSKDGVSLNSCLYAGPPLNPQIFHLLVRMRISKEIALSDIEMAFLQLLVQEEFQDYLRYLWIDEKVFDQEVLWDTFAQYVKVMKMKVVTFGVSSSPFLLALVIRHHCKKYEEWTPQLIKEIMTGTYVDDLLLGKDNKRELFDACQGARAIFSDAKLPLVKWVASSPKVNQHLKDHGFSLRREEIDGDSREKVLGLDWWIQEDRISIHWNRPKRRINTKRELLSVIASVFDPLGLNCPLMVGAKLLLQQCWTLGIGWDQELDEASQGCINTWIEEWDQASKYTYSRWVGTSTSYKWELWVFCDASPVAYGYAMYVRHPSGPYELLCAKNRLAPLKTTLTLPRLELMAAWLATKAVKTMLENFLPGQGPDRIHFRTDSQIVLAWITSDQTHWKPFVTNRVREIQETTRVENWGYVPTERNPADLVTRDITWVALKKRHNFWKGLTLRDEDVWEDRSWSTDEEKVDRVNVITVGRSEAQEIFKRFSSWTRLKRVIAWILRWRLGRTSDGEDHVLGIQEMQRSAAYILKLSQEHWFAEEYASFQEGTEINPKSTLRDLDPYIDRNTGLLRLTGRLQKSNLPVAERNPIILKPNEHVTRLILHDIHEETLHGGAGDVLYASRGTYWVIRGRRETRAVVRACGVCKRERLRGIRLKEAVLPQERVSRSNPFAHIGVDFAGPFWVEDPTKKRNDSKIKVYILLATCMATRAIHLEVVRSLSTSDFLLAFRKLVAIRGAPIQVLSDNALTFKTANTVLNVWAAYQSDDQVQGLLTAKGISWKFIPAYSPNWGGFYERLVGSVKQRLRKVARQFTLTYDEFVTTCYEIMDVINSRPLTYVTEDQEGFRPLCPNNFLKGGVPYVTWTYRGDRDIRSKDLKRQERRRIRMLNWLWGRWTGEYLRFLQRFNKRRYGRIDCVFKEGEVVLIETLMKNPYLWPLARIIKLHRGRDGIFRSATVRFASGVESQRRLEQLISLELPEEERQGT